MAVLSDFSVAIAGTGLSGLCLAQYLMRSGVDVHVYERDPGPFVRRQLPIPTQRTVAWAKLPPSSG